MSLSRPKMTNGVRMDRLGLKVILASLLFYVPVAQAEVLNKFGGCQPPSSLKWLLMFVIIIVFLAFFKKKKLAKIATYLSVAYIIIDILWRFLMAKKLIPGWYDPAMFDFYTEIERCPQYENIGYWQQSWLAVLIYFCVVLCVFKVMRFRQD